MTAAHESGGHGGQSTLRLLNRQAARESPRGGGVDAGHGQAISAVARSAVAFFAGAFFAVAFLAVAFFAVAFFAVAFLAVAFLVAVFFVVVFLAARFRVTGPRARFSASSSAPRSGVIVSGSSSVRRVALVSPSVT